MIGTSNWERIFCKILSPSSRPIPRLLVIASRFALSNAVLKSKLKWSLVERFLRKSAARKAPSSFSRAHGPRIKKIGLLLPTE